MKELLLSMGAALVASSSFAQVQVANPGMVKMTQSIEQYKGSLEFSRVTGVQKGAQKSPATGNYWSMPSGVGAVAMNPEWMGYSNSRIVLPPFTDVTFEKVGRGKWYFGENSAEDYANADGSLTMAYRPTVYDIDADGSLTLAGQGLYYLPSLVNGRDAFYYGKGDKDTGWILTLGEPSPFSFIDRNTGPTYYGTGMMDNGYFWGSGTMTEEDGTVLKGVGITQHFAAPVSPMYVENIFIHTLSLDTDQPLKNGAVLTLEVVNDNEEVIAVLTADASDVLVQDESFAASAGEVYTSSVTFSKKVVDDLTGETIQEPFVIDEPFSINLVGMDNPDVNLGLYGFVADELSNTEKTRQLVLTPEGEYYEYNYQADLVALISFTAMFDYVEPASSVYTGTAEYENANVLTVSADGATVANYGCPEMENCVEINTATPWDGWDGGTYNYYADEDATWFTLELDPSFWFNENGQGTSLCTVECDPLPAGVSGRSAVVYLYGRGYTSKTPIIVCQGDVNVDDIITSGIQSVVPATANKNLKSFNILGQAVKADAKGLVIKNGKKFINK